MVLRPHLTRLDSAVDVPLTARLGDLGLDSLEVIEFVLNLEEEFDIVIPDDVLSAELFDSVTVLENAVAELLRAQRVDVS
ncbi:MAG TPA: hypothetical protein DGG94_16755 [Micromonosporaceae bacterium]|nr:hypothetical protein [Micromonosporaceae bacterium]HCU51422.1 hypothetical protein [Micromonosporaceae bacterium]